MAAFCGLWLLVLAGCERQASIPQGVQVFFSPRAGATQAVTNALAQATNSILVQAYSFTSAPIAEALVAAHRRGVTVQVILDHSQRTEKYSEADFLSHNEIRTLIDSQHAIAHNKIMIIDGYVVLTGSFNFTKAAEEKNAENLLLINDPVLARTYVENWQAHEQHSEPYARNEANPARTHRPIPPKGALYNRRSEFLQVLAEGNPFLGLPFLKECQGSFGARICRSGCAAP